MHRRGMGHGAEMHGHHMQRQMAMMHLMMQMMMDHIDMLDPPHIVRLLRAPRPGRWQWPSDGPRTARGYRECTASMRFCPQTSRWPRQKRC